MSIRVRAGCLSLLISCPLPLSPVSISIAIVRSVVSTPVSPVRVSLSIRVGSRSLGTGRCFLTNGKTKEGQGNLWKKIGKINSEKLKSESCLPVSSFRDKMPLLYVQCVQPPSELELWSDCRRAIISRIIYSDSVIDGCHAMNTLTKLSPSLAPNNRLHTRWFTRDVMALSLSRHDPCQQCLLMSETISDASVCVRLLLATKDYSVLWLAEWDAAYLGCHHTCKKVFLVRCTVG